MPVVEITSNEIYFNVPTNTFGGCVGIGTTLPTTALDVVGTVKATQFIGDGSMLTSVVASSSGWTSNVDAVYNLSQNIGIGTSTVNASVHVYHTGTGDILRIDDSTTTNTTPFLINQDGNIGIGTNGVFRTHINAKFRKTMGRYVPIAFEDYELTNAYSSRVTALPFSGNDNDEGYVALPDIGFDFYINEVNYRNSIYVWANSRFSFGSANANILTTPNLFVGNEDWVQNDISYYSGTYNNTPAFYVFFDGYQYNQPSRLMKVCVIIQSNKFYIYLKTIHHSSVARFEFTEKNLDVLVTLPEHFASINPAIVNKAYMISIYQQPKGIAVYSDGDMICQQNVGIGTTTPSSSLHVAGPVDIGLGTLSRYPPLSLTSNITSFDYTPYGNGTYVASASSSLAPNPEYFAFLYGTNGALLKGYNAYSYPSGEYAGNVSTTFKDFSNNTETLFGEWVQIQLPVPVAFKQYGLVGMVLSPRKFVLLGSKDSETWTLIDDRRGSEVSYNPSPNMTLFDITSSVKYQYYRLITTLAGTFNNTSYVYIRSLSFYVTNTTQAKINGNTYILGNVGIGTTTPSSSLDVIGSIKATTFAGSGALLTSLDVGNVSAGTLGVARGGIGTATLSANKLLVGNGTSALIQPTNLHWDDTNSRLGIGSTQPMQVLDVSGNGIFSGNVGIGTTNAVTQLTVNGTIRNINGPAPTSGTSLVITGDGDIAPQSSDARYKTNVEDLPSVLDAMMNMRAVSYHWKDEPQKWYGLLAQQVSEVFPEAAWHNTENDTYGVHYTPTVVTLLLKAMQEMKLNYDQRISSLETELENIRGVLPHEV